jgi:hypothetical protein
MKERKKKISEISPAHQAFEKVIIEQLLGPAGAKAAAKDNKDAWRDRQSKRKQHCSYNGCFSVNDGDNKFSRCKKCWEVMHREVLYCSACVNPLFSYRFRCLTFAHSQCQKADWTLHHKAICGKPLNFDAVSKRVPDPPPKAPSPPAVPSPPAPSSPVIGPPVGGYTRPPSLMYQIAKLNERPKIDYVITASADDPIFIDFPDPEAQSLFRKCREKAMATGDRQSVAVMAHFLCWMTMEDPNFISKGATSTAIVDQLKKEYKFDELHLAVNEMQRRQSLDPWRRPYVPDLVCACHSLYVL